MRRIPLAIFLSGRGSNARALIQASQHKAFPAEIAVVISDNPDALGLKMAREAGIDSYAVSPKDFNGDRNHHEAAINDILQRYHVEYICLAGYMRLLEDTLLTHYPQHIFNIHPSLLPAFKGLHTHERALKRGVKIHGCTVHLVTKAMDEGPILGQRAVRVIDEDTPDRLAHRVLEAEHQLYPQIVQEFLNNVDMLPPSQS